MRQFRCATIGATFSLTLFLLGCQPPLQGLYGPPDPKPDGGATGSGGVSGSGGLGGAASSASTGHSGSGGSAGGPHSGSVSASSSASSSSGAPPPVDAGPDAPSSHPDSGPKTCAHDRCDASGAALDPDCDPCVALVCQENENPNCCVSGWAPGCAQYVDLLCGDAGAFGVCGTGGGSCSHDACVAGVALDQNCNLCAWEICSHTHPECCTDAWTQACVDVVALFCKPCS